MQGLSDGYFVIPYTHRQLSRQHEIRKVGRDHPEFKAAEENVAAMVRNASVHSAANAPSAPFHRELGKLMWDYCGMARNAEGLKHAIGRIQELREEFWRNVNVLGDNDG